MNTQLYNELHAQCISREVRGTNASNSYVVDKFDSEKFAQLIVRECVEQLRYTVLDTQELRRNKSTDYQVGWEDGMFDAEEMIKQHFGVEE